MSMVQTGRLTFEVVVDVQTAQLDEAFTYAAGAVGLCIGARVRVPFRGRVVNGWVVASSSNKAVQGELKEIAEVLPDPPIDEKAIALAGWLRRRYACTYREALLAVTPRGEAEWLDRFRFASEPSAVDEQAHALYERFKQKAFSAVAARRVLNTRAKRMPLALIRRLLVRLTQSGLLERALEPPKPPERLASGSQLALVDGGKARGAAQTRLAAALAEAGGSLFFDVAKQLGVSAASVNRAAASGMLRVQHNVTRRPRVPGAAPGPTEPIILTPTAEQDAAIGLIDNTIRVGWSTTLLHGVTGSGKTLVYSRLVDRVRARGGQSIVLVPEIALTPQTAGRFVAAFGAKIAVLHSGLSTKARAAVWQAAEQGALDVIVGARSAVFAPLPQPRLVIIDEEHEPSYKQDVAPRYDVAAVAAERMRLTGGSVILGSATPSLESYWRARNGEIRYVRLTQRATMAPLPSVEVVNLADQPRAQRNQPLSPPLAAAVESTLARGEKALLFVNRRGYAGLLLCRSCGFAPRCKRCAVSLVIHSADHAMRCHICGDGFRIPEQCPKCSSTDLRPYGFGTQRVEEEARALFPAARVIRMDSDTTGAQGAHERLLHDFAGEGDILIGTQMIAKGLDYPT
ncbi:MAG: primosomal protein N', partial [Candidatus Eremiobacteraeota bacterium]|nr:primosomal protein N' [Candidatus Eremiobacteraeota bacterium]